jgi:hypothetical protein
MAKAKTFCRHQPYPTAMAAIKAAKQSNLRGKRNEVEQCKLCKKWRIKEGL